MAWTNFRAIAVRSALLRLKLAELLNKLAAKLETTLSGNLDLPALDSHVSKQLHVKGWVTVGSDRILEIAVFLNGERLGNAQYGLPRPDVLAARPWQGQLNCGFTGAFNLSACTGVQELLIRVLTQGGSGLEFRRLVTIEPTAIDPYVLWLNHTEPAEALLQDQLLNQVQWSYRPLISFLAVLNRFDEALIASLLKQTYPNWELCLALTSADLVDKFSIQANRFRLKIVSPAQSQSQQLNEALQLAEGDFLAVLSLDCRVAPNALYEFVTLLQSQPQADFAYSDDDKLKADGQRTQPAFKPDWSPDLMRSTGYTGQLSFYRTKLIRQLGGWREGLEPAHHYDLALRVSEQTNQIHHISKILYHSPQDPVYEVLTWHPAYFRALTEQGWRLGFRGLVEPGLTPNSLRFHYYPASLPKVTIIIPTRDQVDLLRRCLQTLQNRTTYPNYEILVMDNDSHETQTLAYLFELEKQPGIRVLPYPGKFNFSAINNAGVAQAESELVLFLNNDIEIITPDWLDAMVEHFARPEVGAVGAKLLYPNGTLQHGGIITGIGGIAGHSHKYWPADETGYGQRTHVVQNFSAVTGACLLTRRTLFQDLGGFDADNLPVAFNDVDYCLRLREHGMLVVWTPYAELLHHESYSRGLEDTPEKQSCYNKAKAYMLQRWGTRLTPDPYYNSNLTLEHENFAIADF
jgi:GT2 family glycosyltransferase